MSGFKHKLKNACKYGPCNKEALDILMKKSLLLLSKIGVFFKLKMVSYWFIICQFRFNCRQGMRCQFQLYYQINVSAYGPN